MAARPLPASAAAKKKPIKVPPVPPHKRQQFDHEGEYENIDTHLIQERIISGAQQIQSVPTVRETTFGPVLSQTSTAAYVQEQLASPGAFQQGPTGTPLSYTREKLKPYQREIDEGEIRKAAPSLEAVSLIIPSPSSIPIDNKGGPDPYPQRPVTIQPLLIPVRAFGFTRERQHPAREYKFMTAGLIVCSILCCCIGFASCLPYICLLLTYVASKMTMKHNIEGDYVSAQSCSLWTLVCGVSTLVCCSIGPAICILTGIIIVITQ